VVLVRLWIEDEFFAQTRLDDEIRHRIVAGATVFLASVTRDPV